MTSGTLNDATDVEIARRARILAKENGLDYDAMDADEQHEWRIEATMTFSWLI